MFSRHTYLVVGLMVAGGTPYLSSKPAFQDRVSSLVPSEGQTAAGQESVYRFASADGNAVASPPSNNPFGGSTVASTSTAAAASNAAAPHNATAAGHSILTVGSQSATKAAATAAGQKPTKVDGSQAIRFEEVFRLDVNSAWLMARWPRVTTGLAELDLHGYRVSLLTGTKEDDLAGALTYYYDKEQVIQKMTFRGVTGDPRRLVHFCTGQYEMVRETVNDPALQVYRNTSTGRKPSELAVRPANVIRADAPRERFEVDFVLHR